MWYLLRLLSQVIMGVWIDLQAHTYSMWKLEPSATTYTGSLTVSGCGFSDFADWGTPATEMVRNGYRYTSTLHQIGSIQVRANTMQPVCPLGDMFSAIGVMRLDAAGGKIPQAQVVEWQAMQAIMTVWCKSPSIQLFFGLQSRK